MIHIIHIQYNQNINNKIDIKHNKHKNIIIYKYIYCIFIIANIMMIRKIRRIQYILYTNVIFLIIYI